MTIILRKREGRLQDSRAKRFLSGDKCHLDVMEGARCAMLIENARDLWRRPAAPPRELERLREPCFQEFAHLGRSLELRDWLQFLERGGEGVGETPNRP